ncbi:hypothetical protein V2J09_001919 [Rumex salicifolius]
MRSESMAVAENGCPSIGQFEAQNHQESHVDCDLGEMDSNQFDDENESGKSNPKVKDQSYNFVSQSPTDTELSVTDAASHVVEGINRADDDNNHSSNGDTDGSDSSGQNYRLLTKSDSYCADNNEDTAGLKRDIRELEEMLTKLNPMAKEFVPSSKVNFQSLYGNSFDHVNSLVMKDNENGYPARRKKNNAGQGKRRMNSRTRMAQRDDVIRRTVYVSDIDQQVTEEQLAALFVNCGQVVDCRVCGDPNSVLRFAFIEFTDEVGAMNALALSGTMLGFYPVRVLPSKTAIAPVNPTFLPRSEDEREMCARTVYCANIDKKVTQAEVKLFFETLCGEVLRLRLLGDYHHSTRIAFVEFVMAESAIAALNCSGAVLGSMPIRVSPSKTPVRPRAPRSLNLLKL